MSDHLSEDELALLAFSREDTPKLRELQHLEACAHCRKRIEGVRSAMRSAQAMLQSHVEPASLDHVRERVLEELAPRPASSVTHSSRARGAGRRPEPQPVGPEASLEPMASRGGRLGGLRALFPITASVLLAAAAGKSTGLSAAIGVDCVLVELGSAAALLGLFGLLAAGAGAARQALLQPSRLASIAATGALIGQALLHTRCEAHAQTLHLFVFHVGAVVLAAGLAQLAGMRFLRPR